MSAAVAVRERPIPFSGEMVRALLEGRKTMTRRVIVPQPEGEPASIREWSVRLAATFGDTNPDPARIVEHGQKLAGRIFPFRHPSGSMWSPQCPFGQPGDRLYVRETWQYADWTEDGYPFIAYRADNASRLVENVPAAWADRLADTWSELSVPTNYDIDGRAADRRWRSPRFMPRWASRLTLEITDVRVERVQDISEDDARAEGVEPDVSDLAGYTPYKSGFAHLWQQLNWKRGYSWGVNPFVWVLSFRRVES